MPPKAKTPVNATFKLVFISVLVIVAVSLIASAYLAAQPTISQQADLLFRATLSVFQVGTGAVFGLLGGNALAIRGEN